MALTQRKKNKSAEEGSPEAEKQRRDEEEKQSELGPLPPQRLEPRMMADAEYQGEEYEVLLRYVQDEQAKLKNKRTDDDDGDDKNAKYTRKWYTPWKKTKVEQGMKRVSPFRCLPGIR